MPVKYIGKVASIHPAPKSVEAFAGMTDSHIWSESFVRMRYEYRPDLPLYMVLVRACRLAHPVEIAYDPRYAGCRSWVELNEEIDVAANQPVLTDKEFEEAVRDLAGLTGAAIR